MKIVPSLEPRASWTRDGLAELLAPALGREQSLELIAGAAAQLGLSSPELDEADAFSIIDTLSDERGLVGVSARFARVRLERRRAVELKFSSRPKQTVAQPALPARAAKPEIGRTFRFAEVAALLENAIGKERSEEILRAEVARLKLCEPFDNDAVLALLERIGESGGVVGTVARFAKSRLMLSAR